METDLSNHAKRRMKDRGIGREYLDLILDHADIERPANGNCRLYRVTKRMAQTLGDERLARFAVIWSDDGGHVVTAVPIACGRAGARYRRRSSMQRQARLGRRGRARARATYRRSMGLR